MLAEVFDYEYKGLTYKYNTDTYKATLTFGGIIDEDGNHNKITNWTVDVPEYIEVGDNKKQYKEWLCIYPETNKHIWRYAQIDWKQKLRLWFAANRMLPAAKAFQYLLELQHRIKTL